MRLVRVRRHVRLIDGALREIPAHWRRIGDAEPKVGAVVRERHPRGERVMPVNPNEAP